MKHLTEVILAFLAGLVALVTGCGRAPHYDARLMSADSLMRSVPDSALAIVQAVGRDSLTTEADRAYHDLLLTQARYRCYVTATSDSAINRALGYYRAHSGEREKLTRAYIYKGAVMEELGQPDSAMIYYKHAESTAAPDDYFNLGYAKMRMAALYGDYYEMDGQDIQKYEEALECYRNTDDTLHLMVCMNNLGCLYREIRPTEAEAMLLKASDLARLWNDTSLIIFNTQALIVLYYHNHNYNKARHLICEVIDYRYPITDYKFFFTASSVYLRLGIPDTSRLYYSLALQCPEKNAQYEMYRLGCLSELALSKHDTLTSLRLEKESERIADALKSNGKKLEILNVDVNYDREQKSLNQQKHFKIVYSFQWIIMVAIFILTLTLIIHYRKTHRYDSLISDLKKESINQTNNLKTLQSNIDKLKITDSVLKDSINSHMYFLREIIEACYHSPRNILAGKIKHLIKFQESNKEVWTQLYLNIDNEYNGIMSHTKMNYPQLGDKELMMIALTCLDYSCAQIAIVLDYSNATSISTIRTRIAKKMRLDISLEQYIKQFKRDKNYIIFYDHSLIRLLGYI